MSDGNYDAREYQSSTFLKKADVKRDGVQRVVVKAVEKADGIARNGKPPKPILQLVFVDDRKFGLSAQVNLNRMIEFFGPRTQGWVGKTIEVYYSPDVRGPNNEEGGLRIRQVETTAPPSLAQDFVAALGGDHVL